jgi:hypothetical protein
MCSCIYLLVFENKDVVNKNITWWAATLVTGHHNNMQHAHVWKVVGVFQPFSRTPYVLLFLVVIDFLFRFGHLSYLKY